MKELTSEKSKYFLSVRKYIIISICIFLPIVTVLTILSSIGIQVDLLARLANGITGVYLFILNVWSIYHAVQLRLFIKDILDTDLKEDINRKNILYIIMEALMLSYVVTYLVNAIIDAKKYVWMYLGFQFLFRIQELVLSYFLYFINEHFLRKKIQEYTFTSESTFEMSDLQ